jgi:hypothetical protein
MLFEFNSPLIVESAMFLACIGAAAVRTFKLPS